MLRTALTSRPSARGRLDSASCLISPLAAIPGGQPLSSGLRFAGFSGDSTPRVNISVFYKATEWLYGCLNLQEPQCRVYKIVWKCAGVRLKIAEAFPVGRGSPHGCGLRARFAGTLHRARPEAGRDKPKAPRSGDFPAGSPGVQGAAATGRPLRALAIRCSVVPQY